MDKQKEYTIRISLDKNTSEQPISYIDLDGDIILKDFKSKSINIIPFQTSYYVQAIYLSDENCRLALCECKEITDEYIELYYPFRYIDDITYILAYGISKDKINTYFPTNKAYIDFNKRADSAPIFGETIYEKYNSKDSVTYFYIDSNKQQQIIYTGDYTVCKILNEYYMHINSMVHGDIPGNIYVFNPDTKQLSKQYEFSNYRYIDVEDNDGDIIALIYLYKISNKNRNYYMYGIFEASYNKERPYAVSTLVANEFFSTKDEYKIREFNTIFFSNCHLVRVINNKRKQNCIMFDGNLLFDKWLDDIEIGFELMTLKYTNEDKETITKRLELSKIKECYFNNKQIKLE